jgi:uncharacterized protein YjbI with pentapeptide repeats
MKKVTLRNNVGHAFIIEKLEEAKKVINKWRKAGELLKLNHEILSMQFDDVLERTSENHQDLSKMTEGDFYKIIESMELKSPIDGRFMDKLKLETFIRESSDIIFNNIDLTDIDWTDVPLINFIFTGTCIVDVKKMISDSYSKIDGCVFIDMDLTGVDWKNKSVESTVFDDCKMNVGDVFSETIITYGNVFANMDLTNVNWENASIRHTIFHNSKVNYVNMIRDAKTIFDTCFVDIDLTGVDVDLSKHKTSYLELCKFLNCVGISDEFKYNIARHNILNTELFERSGEEEGLMDVLDIYDHRFKTTQNNETLATKIETYINDMFNCGEKLEKHMNIQSLVENILVDIRMNTSSVAN